jgi:hypothetical protein
MDSKFVAYGGFFLIAIVLVAGVVFYGDVPITGMAGLGGYDNTVTVSTCGPTVIKDANTHVLISAELECLETPIKIGASNVLVDCQGHTLTGKGSSTGIQIGLSPKYSDINADVVNNVKPKVTVQNCKLENWDRGIMVYETSSSFDSGLRKLDNPTENIHIINVEANNNYLEGISFWRVDGGSITKSKATGNKQGGLKLYQSINLKIGENVEDENDFTGNTKYDVECAYPDRFYENMNVGGDNNKVGSVSYYCRGPVWPVVCAGDNDCDGNTPYCNIEFGNCVACMDDNQCDNVCVDNKCVECRESTDCGEEQVCDSNYCMEQQQEGANLGEGEGGEGIGDPEEEVLGNYTCSPDGSCVSPDGYKGVQSCSIEPTEWCGDEIINGPESCDGASSIECQSNGYNGVKTCTDSCSLSNCKLSEFCGDKIVNGLEECDGSKFSEDGLQTECGEGFNLKCSGCQVVCAEKIEVKEPELHTWKLEIKTHPRVPHSGTNAKVFVYFNNQKIHLDTPANDFEKGDTNHFIFNAQVPGDTNLVNTIKFCIENPDNTDGPGWYPAYAIFEDITSKKEYHMVLNGWVKEGECLVRDWSDTKSIWRIKLMTSSYPSAGTDEKVTAYLCGVKNVFDLNTPDYDDFEAGNTDYFYVGGDNCEKPDVCYSLAGKAPTGFTIFAAMEYPEFNDDWLVTYAEMKNLRTGFIRKNNYNNGYGLDNAKTIDRGGYCAFTNMVEET